MKKLFLGLSLFSFGLFHLQAQTTILPYSNSFTSLTGTTSKSTTTTVPYASDYGITLTDAASQSTLIYLDDLNIATGDGFKISFNFNMYETKLNTDPGDGFALVLFDTSNASTVTAGKSGSGLGYAYGRGTSTQTNGLTGAYMGIGFDAYGSFKNYSSSGDDYRAGLYLDKNSAVRDARGAITIRGPVQQTSVIANVPIQQQGYPLLFTQNVRHPEVANSKYVLNSTGDYDTSSDTSLPKLTLYTDKRSESANDASYRRAVFLMIPGSKSGVNGYYMNLYVNHADSLTRVVTDFFINASEKVKYKEIIKAGTTNSSATNNMITSTISLAPPDILKLGFTASTGGAYEKVTISNLNVTLPFAAVAQDFSVDDLCATKGNTTSFDALSTSAGYDSKTYDPNVTKLPDVKNIDKTSFQFMVVNSSGLFEASETPHSMTTQYGTYTYDEITGYITFKSSKTITEEGVSENLNFSVKSLAPLDSHNYRSIAATITAKFKTGCPVSARRYIMINR